jgi:hypothetical protein
MVMDIFVCFLFYIYLFSTFIYMYLFICIYLFISFHLLFSAFILPPQPESTPRSPDRFGPSAPSAVPAARRPPCAMRWRPIIGGALLATLAIGVYY